jgi:mannose-6-phosphate isomerase-like protein (cupin superfamily)
MTTLETPTTAVNQDELEALEKVDAYEAWQKSEGVPIVSGFYVEDLNELEVKPWARKGGKGAFVNLEGTGGVNDTHVVEIEPGGTSTPERHLYEEMVYILSGRGSTSIWYDEAHKQTFEWRTGSLFAIPLNANYQHFNASGLQPARYMAVTNAPTVMRLFHNSDFIFNTPYAFTDRYSGDSNYFSGEGKLYKRRIWETNFVADTHNMQLHEWKERGGGGTNVMLELAQNTMGAHISQFQIGTYKKAHRHGPGAHVIILDGVGFSLLWQEGDADYKKCDWKPNSVVVPPENWFHQHFNTGPQPARYLALRFSGIKFRPMNRPDGRTTEGADVSVKLGGWQIEYEDEDFRIHQIFEDDCRKHGGVCRMKAIIPGCTGEMGPTTIRQSGE